MKRKKSKIILIILGIIATGLVGLAVYAKYGQPKTTAGKPNSAAPPLPTGTSQPTPPPTAKTYAPTGGNTSSSPSSGTTSSPTTSLPAPSGQLLNVQTVSLASGPGLESVCQTIANASCDIRLTNNGTVKYVGAQNTGSSGDVIFDWTAKAVGLTPGYWTVQAIVTQNGGTGVSHSEYLTVTP